LFSIFRFMFSGSLNHHHWKISHTHISILIHENSRSCSSAWIIKRESLFDSHRSQSLPPSISAPINLSPPTPAFTYLSPQSFHYDHIHSILLRTQRSLSLTSQHKHRKRTFRACPNTETRYHPLADAYLRCSLRSRVSGMVYEGEDWFEEEFQD
jgi:hypothetical protein